MPERLAFFHDSEIFLSLEFVFKINFFFAFQELIKDMLVAEKLASSIMTDVQSVLREFRKEVNSVLTLMVI